MKENIPFYDPDRYAAYPGFRDPLLDNYVRGWRSEDPVGAVETLVSMQPRVDLILAALVATAHFARAPEVDRALRRYVVVTTRRELNEIDPSVYLAAMGRFQESAGVHQSLSETRMTGPPEYETAAIETLMTWGHLEEATERLLSLRGRVNDLEWRLLSARISIRKDDCQVALDELEPIYTVEPDAMIAFAYCVHMLKDFSLDPRMLELLEPIPRTYLKRFEVMYEIFMRRHDSGNSFRTLWAWARWRAVQTRALSKLIKELDRRV